jgi:hypothetical protein
MRDAVAVAGDDAIGARAAARTRIAAWLLHGPAQLRAGAHAGAVGGVVHAGAVTYAYPEITGYFLQWLAWRVHMGHASTALRDRAQAAQAWLARWAADPAPPARVHLGPHAPDWRTQSSFAFDLAMVLRGLASAVATDLLAPDRRLTERLSDLLARLRERDGALDACRAYADAAAPPARWSTQRGPFLAKAAAGILAAAALPGVSRHVHDAAERAFAEFCARVRTDAHLEAHPRLYAIEGLLARARDPDAMGVLPHAAAQVVSLVDTARALGHVPEHADGGGVARLDVHAQALRAACVLAALGATPSVALATRATLADALAARVGADGGVSFSPSSPPGELNVWTAMFAEQALTLVDLPARAVADAGGWLV